MIDRVASTTLVLLMLVGALVGGASEASAQGRGPTDGRRAADDGWWRVEPSPDRYARRHDRRYDRRHDRRHDRRNHRRDAPPFCRSGRGHPVHGYRWCVENGFAPPRRYAHRPSPRRHWRPYRHDRVLVVRHAPVRVVRPRVAFDVRVIVDLLGPGLYGDIRGHARRHGYRGTPVARWVPYGDRGWVLQVRQHGRPLAELVDVDGDRRLDAVWFYEGRPDDRPHDRYEDRYGDRYDRRDGRRW